MGKIVLFHGSPNKEIKPTYLHEVVSELTSVPFESFNEKYNERDVSARRKMKELIDSDANKVVNVFSTLL